MEHLAIREICLQRKYFLGFFHGTVAEMME